MSEKRVTGPIQVFVIGFEKFKETGKILAELRRVRKRGVIRLVDLLFVQKDRQGSVSNAMHMTDLSESERQRLGAVAGGLIGLQLGGAEGALAGAEMGAMRVAERDYGLSSDQLKDLADSIPNGSAAAILVIEHHWATNLRNAISEAGGAQCGKYDREQRIYVAVNDGAKLDSTGAQRGAGGSGPSVGARQGRVPG